MSIGEGLSAVGGCILAVVVVVAIFCEAVRLRRLHGRRERP